MSEPDFTALSIGNVRSGKISFEDALMQQVYIIGRSTLIGEKVTITGEGKITQYPPTPEAIKIFCIMGNIYFKKDKIALDYKNTSSMYWFEQYAQMLEKLNEMGKLIEEEITEEYE
jgi:hypothetical protein